MYSAEINRNHRACLLLLIDQSFSMSEPWAGTESSKSHALAQAVNKLLGNATLLCSKGDERVNDYFEVGVLGYGADVASVLHGSNSARPLVPIGELARQPMRVDEILRKVPDGAGGIMQLPMKLPVWVDPSNNGKTPMVQALREADRITRAWCANNSSNFPPIVINITDGVSTDGDPTEAAESLRSTGTDDGRTLLFNLHLSANPVQISALPNTSSGLPDAHAVRLFEMTSELPSVLLEAASSIGYNVQPGSRGFLYNADATSMIEFLDIGTRAVTPTGLRELTSGKPS
ncbi:vWA domain-containing protein [Saccharopolyspora sp. NPDC047091]|uniref:vWA domain-containing protein n=1 Tax=Saccharopolyspora sp. NPDC047091 TaxID=3155924 RepID=UPI0033F5A64A